MQEEVNEKTISLCVQCSRMTASVLKDVMRKSLNDLERKKQKHDQVKQAEKNGQANEKGRRKEQLRQEKKTPKGKQTMQNLMAKGAQLTNILITDDNIKSFDRIARKYGIDYSLKRDNSVTPPKYLVFFRAKDVDVMTAAFREYTGVTMNKAKKPSVRKKLQQTIPAGWQSIGNVSRPDRKTGGRNDETTERRIASQAERIREILDWNNFSSTSDHDECSISVRVLYSRQRSLVVPGIALGKV